MNTFVRSVVKTFEGMLLSFKRYPETIACALAFSLVTIVRIHLDWEEQKAYNFILNALHWTFAFGALFSLALVTFEKSRMNKRQTRLLVGVAVGGTAILTFVLLFLFGGADPAFAGLGSGSLSALAIARVSAAMYCSLVAFVILAAYSNGRSDFSKAFFMSHKAFFTALIYGSVLLGGTSGVAGAVQALLYENMSSKVYMYIGTLAGFITFAIFVGFFPDFTKDKEDERRDIAEKQPKFIEILLGYILTPVMLALTLVLLIWTGKTVAAGIEASFMQLARIASMYALGGIWLSFMTVGYENGVSRFYRKAFPVAALLILTAEVWSIAVQVGESGWKTTEYVVSLILILAVVAAVLFLLKKKNAQVLIALLSAFLVLVSVLPMAGYHAFPVRDQISRLEGFLAQEGMLKGDELTPAEKEPALSVREGITDAVAFLAYAQSAKLPSWFDRNMGDSYSFKKAFGFEQAWPEPDYSGPSDTGAYIGVSLRLPVEMVDISGYDWAVTLNDFESKGSAAVEMETEKGLYQIQWVINTPDGIPELRIALDDRSLVEKDLRDYIDGVTKKYPPGKNQSVNASLEDMCYKVETPEISVLLVFSNVDVGIDMQNDDFQYWLSLNALYFKEK